MNGGEYKPGWGNAIRGWTEPVKAATILGLSIVLASVVWSLSPGHRVGRYQLVGNPGHLCVIDTATGRVWEKFAPSSSGETDGGWKDPK